MQRPDVARHRPAVLGRKRLFELRHGGAGDPDRDLAVDVDRRHAAHQVAVGEVRGRGALELFRLRAVAAAGQAVTCQALVAIHGRSTRQGRRPARERIERPPRRGGDAPDQGVGPRRDGVGGSGTHHHGPEQGELGVGHGADPGGQADSVEARLLEELARFVHFRGRGDPTAVRRHARRVLFGGKRRGRDHAPRYGERIGRLRRGPGRGARAQQQADKQLTMDDSDSQ